MLRRLAGLGLTQEKLVHFPLLVEEEARGGGGREEERPAVAATATWARRVSEEEDLPLEAPGVCLWKKRLRDKGGDGKKKEEAAGKK